MSSNAMITLRGVGEDDAVKLHAATQFDAKKLPSTTRRILERAGVTLSAAGTVPGMTVAQVDEMFGRIKPPLLNTEQIALKLNLRAQGILRG